MKSKTAYLLEPGKFELRERDIVIKEDEVLVKVAVCGLCNWEKGFFTGDLEGAPCTLGHEWAGIVVECGSAVKNLKPGDKVTALPPELEGFAEYASVKECDCFRLQDSVNIYESFTEPQKCIITVLRSAMPEAGDYGVVVGCGPMGLWCVQALAGHMLAGLIAVDIDDRKLALAEKFGATHIINSTKEDVRKAVEQYTGGHMADFVIEGTGNPSLIPVATDLLRHHRGRLVLMSYYERKLNEFNIQPWSDKGAIVINPHPAYSEDGREDGRRAVSLINNGTFSQRELITHRFALDDIQAAFTALAEKPDGYIKGVVICNEGM